MIHARDLPPALRAQLKLTSPDGHRRACVKSGAAAESLVENLFAHWQRDGIARIRKIPTPTVGPNGARRFAKKSGVDYIGCVLSGEQSGRAIYLEAKRATKKRFYLAEVEEHQAEELDAAHLAGAIAAIVVVFGARREIFMVPWIDAKGHISLTEEQLRERHFTLTPRVPR